MTAIEIYEKITEKIGKDYVVAIYKQPRYEELNGQKVRIVAKAYSADGDKVARIKEETWKEAGEVLKSKAKKVFNSVEQAERYFWYKTKEDLKDSGTNKFWVRCWECGRPIPPGQGFWDGNGWYCGC